MKLQKMIAAIHPALLEKAELLLMSEEFINLEDFDDGYEAFIATEDGFLLPVVTLEQNGEVLEYDCSCKGGSGICVHVAAMLLGIEKMRQTGCFNYHEAIAKLNQGDVV